MAKKPKQTTDDSVRSHIIKGEVRSSNLIASILNPHSSTNTPYIAPPLQLDRLNVYMDVSAHLRPQIESYVVNVHSRGHTFVPVVELDGPDAEARVKDSLVVDALLDNNRDDKPLSDAAEPNEAAIASKIEEYKIKFKLELAKATSFFSSCSPDSCFNTLREVTAQDLEVSGNAYWEVVRGADNTVRHLYRVCASAIRIASCNEESLAFENKRFTDLLWRKIKVKRSFKKFVEISADGKIKCWFKEFGNNKLMSSKSGLYYADAAAMLVEEGKEAKPATEIFHFLIPNSADTPYGVPRWIGNLPAVLGSRELDETNLDYFVSNAVPALAIMISGGKFGKGTVERLKEFFNEDIKGKHSTHRVIVLEAEPQRVGATIPSTVPKITLEPLRNAQINDGLFQEYDKNNEAKIRGSFRLPASLVGKSKFALSELRFAEDQIFRPLRNDFDDIMNKFFMPEIGVNFWKFKSNDNVIRDGDTVSKIVLDAVREGVLVPDEARKILGKIIQEELQPFGTIWATQPLPLTLAIMGIKAGPAEAVREQGRQDGNTSPMEAILQELGLDINLDDVYTNSEEGNKEVAEKLIKRLKEL